MCSGKQQAPTLSLQVTWLIVSNPCTEGSIEKTKSLEISWLLLLLLYASRNFLNFKPSRDFNHPHNPPRQVPKEQLCLYLGLLSLQSRTHKQALLLGTPVDALGVSYIDYSLGSAAPVSVQWQC